MKSLPYDPALLHSRAAEIVVATRELSALGWTPATSSNFSMRLDDKHAAITVSGRDKGRLNDSDIMVVDFDGRPVATSHQPSAETLLHTQLYKRCPDIGCVLHTHSLNQTLASRLYAGAGHVRFEDYELIKAFRGQDTHATRMDVPVLANNQHIPTLAAQVDVLLDAGSDVVNTAAFADARSVPQACRNCDHLAACRGGCSGRRRLMGMLAEPDPYCPIVQGKTRKLTVRMAETRDMPKLESACTTIVTAR